MVGFPLFGKEGSGTPVFKILVRALSSIRHLVWKMSFEEFEDDNDGCYFGY